MERYCEQVVNGPFNRGKISTIGETSNLDINCYGSKVEDAYHSVYMYNETMVEHVTDTGGIRGFKGPVYADGLVWDFDSEELEKSLEDTREMVERIMGEGITSSAIRVFYSGSKGFHIYLGSTDMANLGLNYKIPQISKYICMKWAEGLETADESIYDRTRIIRIPNSLHPSGRYKIELTIDELNTYGAEQIERMASIQRNIHGNVSLLKETCAFITYTLKAAQTDESLDNKRKNGRLDILDGLYNGFDNGNGNNGLTSVAGMLHSRNISQSMIRGILHSINASWEDPMADRELDTIVESVANYNIHEDFRPVDDDDIKTMEQASKQWETLKSKRNYVNTGFKGLDEHLVNFDPGKVMMIAARGGVGKTTLGMQMANRMAESLGGYSLFLSLEMPASAIYYRASQIEHNEMGNQSDAKEFTEMLLDDPTIKQRTVDNWKHTLLVDKDSLSIEAVEQYFHKANDKFDNNVKMIFLDYVGLMSGTDDYKGLSKVAREVKALAKRLNIRIILLVQLSRKAGDGTIEPGLHMLRDSGSLEEAADIVLGMWLSPADQSRVHNKFLKNRDGERGGTFDLIQEGLKYTCVEFDDSNDVAQGDTRW